MIVLGIGTEEDSGAALVRDGRLVAAVNEERLSRLKLVQGFPHGSVEEVLRLAGAQVGDLAAVMVASTSELFVEELRPFDGWFTYHRGQGGAGGLLKRAAGRLSRYRDRLPFLEKGYYALLQPSFALRRRRIRRILRDRYGVRCPIVFVDHHLCHVASAYFTSGLDDALVVSLDGGGDGRSGLVYAVRDGRFQPLVDVSAYNSLGNYYAYVTHLCGFKAMKHEGKITGLAAYGEPRYQDLLRSFVDEEHGRILNRGGVALGEAIRELDRRLPHGWAREDLAASVQRHFEDVVSRFVGHWMRASGLADLALAGGVFANVRVNGELHELPGAGRLFIHPHMGDGGLPAGAALAAGIPGMLPRTMPRDPEPLAHAYLGPDLEEAEIQRALRDHGLQAESLDAPLEETVADLLARGHVVARAAGPMEYGPRALGNRSILYQPTDRDVNDWLNRNLRRTEFMPFAPSLLADAGERCFERLEGAEHAAEFMTITFRCTPYTSDRMKGVVHIDGTARPHLVHADRNPEYHRILEAFRRLTGLPGIINTSFNMHEEPIVCSADDCVRAFLDGRLDYLALGPVLVKHPRGPGRALSPVRGADRTAVEA